MIYFVRMGARVTWSTQSVGPGTCKGQAALQGFLHRCDAPPQWAAARRRRRCPPGTQHHCLQPPARRAESASPFYISLHAVLIRLPPGSCAQALQRLRSGGAALRVILDAAHNEIHNVLHESEADARR